MQKKIFSKSDEKSELDWLDLIMQFGYQNQSNKWFQWNLPDSYSPIETTVQEKFSKWKNAQSFNFSKVDKTPNNSSYIDINLLKLFSLQAREVKIVMGMKECPLFPQ